MKASEAREITDKSCTIWPCIFRQIKKAAKEGCNRVEVYGLSDKEVDHLEELGYTVDSISGYLFEVSW